MGRLFEKERECLARLLPQLLETGQCGRWIAIVDDLVVGTFKSPIEAHAAGVGVAGYERTFLIQRIDSPAARPER